MQEFKNLDHVALIMDGNGRWAKNNGMPRYEGHKIGAKRVREIIEACLENDIKYLTLYAFSIENWERPSQEVEFLMELLKYYLKNEIEELHQKGIKISVIGDMSLLDHEIIKNIEEAKDLTKFNDKVVVNIALSYSGRREIVDACKKISEKILDKSITINQINTDLFVEFMYNNSLPDPDLLIRTSGEQRLSNFLLWQIAYTELYFTKILWPDFTKENFMDAINYFKSRERRYGRI